MKPSANLFRQRLSHQFNKANLEFLESLHFFNPESQILHLFSTIVETNKKSSLIRLITWLGLTDKGAITNKLYDRQEFPFRNYLNTVIDTICEQNFQDYLKHPEKISEKLINYKIENVQWFIKLGTVRNPYAPPMSVKRMDYGIRINKKESGLTACFQSVAPELYTSDHNLTKVIPITHENFERVLKWHAEEAKNYLKDKEKNNA